MATATAADRTTLRHGGQDFARGQVLGVEVDSAGLLRLESYAGINLASGRAATSGPLTLTGSQSVTDGDTSTEWRFGNKAHLLGEEITIVLDGDRALTQVRILPGETLQQRPRFYLKGYRIEVAPAGAPDDWVLAAQLRDNIQPLVDTTLDSTWLDTDGQGRPLPVQGQYVRLRVTREDPPNWVSIGEVELYGTGYRQAGEMVSPVMDAGRPVNFGPMRVAGLAPAETRLNVQARTTSDTALWAQWHEVPSWTLPGESSSGSVEIAAPEPARYLQYRVLMESRRALLSPSLQTVELEFDDSLLATAVLVGIEPRHPVLGEETRFTYRLAATLDEGNLGFDLIEIGLQGIVQEVRVHGLALPASEYVSEWDESGLLLHLGAASRVTGTAVVEVDFSAVLLQPVLVVRSAVGLSSAGEPLNFQNTRPESDGAWILRGKGVQSSVLLSDAVQIEPNPFNAAAGATEIRLDLGKVQVPRPVTVRLYDLSGRLVRTLWKGREAAAGRHRLRWDGRSESGTWAPPGIYLLRVDVEADAGAVWVGTVGVIY